MKIVYINGSPKKGLSVSGYFIKLQSFFSGMHSLQEKLRNRQDYNRILENIQDADAIVFCLPLYIDSVPSHVLAFMTELETFCKEKNLHFKVYVISNGGFIEGNQNRALMGVFQNFCKRSNLTFGGGIGIGGGVMLNVLRILFWVFTGMFLLNFVIYGMKYNDWFAVGVIRTYIIQVAEILFFYLGVFFCMLRMGAALRKGASIHPQYTRVLLPSFVFILIADVFFLLMSFVNGGLFRGWFCKK